MSLRDKLVPSKFRPHHAVAPRGRWKSFQTVLKCGASPLAHLVAAIASGVEAQRASCRRADCGYKRTASRRPTPPPRHHSHQPIPLPSKAVKGGPGGISPPAVGSRGGRASPGGAPRGAGSASYYFVAFATKTCSERGRGREGWVAKDGRLCGMAGDPEFGTEFVIACATPVPRECGRMGRPPPGRPTSRSVFSSRLLGSAFGGKNDVAWCSVVFVFLLEWKRRRYTNSIKKVFVRF